MGDLVFWSCVGVLGGIVAWWIKEATQGSVVTPKEVQRRRR